MFAHSSCETLISQTGVHGHTQTGQMFNNPYGGYNYMASPMVDMPPDAGLVHPYRAMPLGNGYYGGQFGGYPNWGYGNGGWGPVHHPYLRYNY
jgi:hypothetical protein